MPSLICLHVSALVSVHTHIMHGCCVKHHSVQRWTFAFDEDDFPPQAHDVTLAVILSLSCRLVISSWVVTVSLSFSVYLLPHSNVSIYQTDKCMYTSTHSWWIRLFHSWLSWSGAGRPSLSVPPPPLNDTQSEWTWHCHQTGTKWAVSNDGSHPSHWLIVLNNAPGSPLWLALEVRGWQSADPSTEHSTDSSDGCRCCESTSSSTEPPVRFQS